MLISSAVKRLWRKSAEHKDFFSFFSINTLMFAAIAAFFPYIGAYYLNRGISVANIGILNAIGPAITLFMQPAWGYASDKTGRRVGTFRITIIGCLLTVLVFNRMSTFEGFAAATAIFAIFNCGIMPLNDAISVNQAVKRGYQYSMIRLGGTVGYALTVMFAGRILRENPAMSFDMTSLIYLLMLTVTFMLPKIYAEDKGERNKLELKKLFQNRKIFFILAFAFVSQCAMGFCNSFLGVYTSSLGYDYSMIGILMCVGAISEIPVLFTIERAIRRFKTETLLVFSGFMLIMRLLLMFTATPVGMIAGQFFCGLTYMVIYYSAVMFINNNLPPELCGTGMAALYVVQYGFASIVCTVLGGRLGQDLGLKSTFLIFAVIILVYNIACILWIAIRSVHGKRVS